MKTGPQLIFSDRADLQATLGRAYALALTNLLTINTITDPTQDHNRSGLFLNPPGTFIRAGGDYQTPWTRDAALNAWSAASLLSPAVAANTLWAVVARRDGQLIVQPDDQWWDQVIWIQASWNHYLITGDRAWLAPAYATSQETLRERERLNFNSVYGLFGGPACLADGISGYPPPLGDRGSGSSFVLDYPDTDKIMVLSTNCVYVGAYRAAENLARALGRPAAEVAEYAIKAIALTAAINRHLWLPDKSTYAYFLYGSGPQAGRIDRSQEGIGLCYAILFAVADPAAARQLGAHAHREPQGIPCVWPHFSGFSDAQPGRHNNMIWPLLSGLWTHALATLGATEAMGQEIITQAQLALRENDFSEIYHAHTGAVDGGWQVGRPWKSCPQQTWSATAYLRSIQLAMFGLNFSAEGIRFAPHLPERWGRVTLSNLPYRGGLLELQLTGQGSQIATLLLNGKKQNAPFLSAEELSGNSQIEVTLTEQS